MSRSARGAPHGSVDARQQYRGLLNLAASPRMRGPGLLHTDRQALPAGALTHPDQALDYFVLSPFFDPQSNNGNLRTQRSVQAAAEGYVYGHAQEKFELWRYTDGFEYVIGHSQPPRMFVIHRRTVREDRSATAPRPDGLPNTYRENPSAMWFVQDGKVYPTPTLYGVMAARLKNASHLVSSTFSSLSAARPPSNPRANLAWRAVDKVASSHTPSADQNDEDMGEADDIAMDGQEDSNAEAGPSRTQPTASAQPVASKLDGEEGNTEPDMQLLSALHSTSLAMEALSKRSAERARAADRDPRDELRRIEMQLLGSSQVISGSGGKDKGLAGNARLGAVRARNTGGLAASTPGSTALGHTPARQQVASPAVGR